MRNHQRVVRKLVVMKKDSIMKYLGRSYFMRYYSRRRVPNLSTFKLEQGLKGLQATTSPIEISASNMAIYSILDNFCVSNVRPDIDEAEKPSLF
jgi:hypothetical protein